MNIRLLINGLLLSILCVSFPLHAQEGSDAPAKKQVVGWIEQVKVFPGEFTMQAKLDAGFSKSSIHAENVKKVRKGKKLFANFELTDRFGTTGKLSREVIRSEKVKDAEGKTKEEHVVMLGMCLGSRYFEDEVRLTSKTREAYDMKIGRQALEGNVLIDPASKSITSPDCGDKGKDLKPLSGGLGAEPKEDSEKADGGGE